MASTPTLRQKNELYKNRSAKGLVGAKASEKTKVVVKTQYPYWAMGLIAFALFGGALIQILDLFF
ncbi:uncharacterized protein EV154DRAFT_506271 [Mucor mucedo]|uniref:uncharacterized protein n=1 Tax=Mucor mucedo TaxID=29922 RepID=UPI00221F95E3|nr:uncharacterized protein EV154DRAFT_506271 [Mucor mucedo]KAI7892092.1 hypothetical protein EV154DRAFT_506271 [Mucor mucedo]